MFCLWNALTIVFYSLGLSPPGFAENVRLLTLLSPNRSECGDRSYGAVGATQAATDMIATAKSILSQPYG
jgi:hypothetical protein